MYNVYVCEYVYYVCMCGCSFVNVCVSVYIIYI